MKINQVCILYVGLLGLSFTLHAEETSSDKTPPATPTTEAAPATPTTEAAPATTEAAPDQDKASRIPTNAAEPQGDAASEQTTITDQTPERLVEEPKRDVSRIYKHDNTATMLGMINVISVKDLITYRDTFYDYKQVMLTGVFTKNLGKRLFEFQDSTGFISVYYKKDTSLITYSIETKTTVTIYGVVDGSVFPKTINMSDIKVK